MYFRDRDRCMLCRCYVDLHDNCDHKQLNERLASSCAGLIESSSRALSQTKAKAVFFCVARG